MVESYLADLEAKVRRAAGKKRAKSVVAELQVHLTESVAELVASGRPEDLASKEAIANLGAVDVRQFVPTDGAPVWFDRRIRGRIASALTVVTAIVMFLCLVCGGSAETANVFVVAFFAGLAAIPVLGCYGARWTFGPILKGLLLVPLVCGAFASLFCVNLGENAPYPRLRLVAEAEHRDAVAMWRTYQGLTRDELSDLSRIVYYYRRSPNSLTEIPASGRASDGGFRYPDANGMTWNSHTKDFGFATKQWQEHGGALQNNIVQAVERHRFDLKNEAVLAGQMYSPLPGIVFSASICLMILVFAVVFALVGDIVRSTALVLVRVFKGRWFKPIPE